MLTPFKQKRVKYDPVTNTRDYIKEKQCFNITGGQKTIVPPIELEDYKLSQMYNCYFLDNEIKSRFGYTTFGNGLPLPEQIMGIKQFTNYAGNSFLCVFTLKNIYKYNVSTKYFDLISPHTDVCDCEDAWTASAEVTATASTTWKRYGTYSAKIVIGADFTTGLAAYRDFAAKNLSTRTHLHFYIKSNVAVAAGDLQILLDDTSGCVSPLESIDIPALEADVEKEINIALDDASLCTAIISVGLKVVTDLGAMTVYIDQIESPTCFTGDTEDRFSFDTIYNSTTGEVLFVATNYIDDILKWVGTGNWEVLGGTPDNSKYIKNYYNYLVCAFVLTTAVDYPTKIQWCVNGKPEDWSGAGSGNNSLTSQAGKIQAMEEIQGQIAIFREKAISNMYIVAGIYEATQTPIPFEFEENRVINVGTPSGWTVQSLGDKLIFLGWDGVYIYDLYNFQNINSENFVEFMANVDPVQLVLSHAMLMSEYSLYILFVPSVGSTTTDSIWVFDYSKKICLGTWKFHDNITACGSYKATSAEVTIGDLTGLIGTFSWKIGGSRPQSLFAASLLGDDSGYIYQIDKDIHNDNNNAIVSFFDTKAYCIKIGFFMRAVLTLIKMSGTDIEVLASSDSGNTFGLSQTESSIPTDGQVKIRDIDMICESIMLRFRVSTLNSWFSIIGWVLRFIEKTKVP